jgi:hypothetical protein
MGTFRRFVNLFRAVLGHPAEMAEGLSDDERTPRSLREVEAEAVALLCLEALGLPARSTPEGSSSTGTETGGGEPIPERPAQRILKAADQILKAGAPAVAVLEDVA